jgi:pyruvate/2-oxoglutarate/acetoin dehydrogenase E1 component
MAVGHGGLYHSQSPEGFFVGASGLKVCFHFSTSTVSKLTEGHVLITDCHPQVANSMQGLALGINP